MTPNLRTSLLLPAALTAVIGLLPQTAQAASIGCIPGGSHPVCKANFAAYPRGTLAAGQSSRGTAVVGGKTVQWTCFGGISRPVRPRQCSW